MWKSAQKMRKSLVVLEKKEKETSRNHCSRPHLHPVIDGYIYTLQNTITKQ